jgi:chemotaxis protein CheC
MKNYENISDFQLDALREIGNIGAGNAATALSDVLKIGF